MTQSNEKSRLISRIMGRFKDQVEGVSHENYNISESNRKLFYVTN